MVIYTDIKPLIVTGFVLVLMNSSDGHPLPQQRKTQDSGSNGRLTMLKKSCVDSSGNIGICMFKWDCISQKGVTLSTCVDGFLFGACCSLKGESKDRWTLDSYFKSSTDSDYEKSNAISLIKYVTLSYLQKTKSSIQQEEARINHTSPTNFHEFTDISLADLTTDSLDVEDTVSELFSIGNTTINNINPSETVLPVLLNFSTDLNHSSLNDQSNITSSGVREEDSKLTTVFKDDFSNLDPESSANFYSTVNLERTQYSEYSKNITMENVHEDYLTTLEVLIKEIQTSSEGELKQPEYNITSICTACDSTKSSFPHETTQSKLDTDVTIQDAFLNAENSNFKSKNKIEDKSFANSTENIIRENNYVVRNVSSSTQKDGENFTTKEISAPVWEDYTSLFPSSFQALISQLTSREASAVGTNVLPTTQSNFTSTNITPNQVAVVIYDNNSNDTEDFANYQESTYIQTIHNTENDNTQTIVNGDMESRENSKITPSNDVVVLDNTNSTTSSHHIKNDDLVNVTGTLPMGVTHYSFNADEEVLIDNKNTENIPVATFSESDSGYPTESVNMLNNDTTKKLEVFCNEEDGLRTENCTKYQTSSTNAQYDELYSLSQSNLKETEDDILSFIRKTLNPLLKPNDENVEILTTVSLDFGKESSFYEEIPALKNLANISNDANEENLLEHSNEHIDQETVVTDISFDQANSESNSFSNEEFLFDITTEVLTYFSKAEVDNPDFSKSDEPNYVLTTSGEENFSSETMKDNLFTPSQTVTQQVDPTSPENITTVSGIANKLSSKNPIITSIGNYEEKWTSLPASYQEYFTTDFKTENSLFKKTTENDFEPTKNLFNIHTTASFDEHEEDTFYQASHLPGNTTTSQNLELIENHTTSSPYEAELNYSGIEHYQQESTKLQISPVVTLNLWQNMTNTYTESTTESLVNISILTTTERISSTDTLYNHSNHLNAMTFTNVHVDIFNEADSNSSVTDTTIPLYYETSSGNYPKTTDALSSFSPGTEKPFSTSSKTTQPQTSEEHVIKNTWNYKKDCGVRPMQPIGRIVGGRNTYFGKWPWQALVKEATWLGLFVKNKCGGVLITSKYVLTAAHCQPGFLASLLVVLGTHDISNLKDNGAPVIRNVKRMVVHRHYNPQTFENDLALLEMDSELEFLPHVVPICLPYRYEDFTGEMAFVTGWGKLTHGGDVPNILQEVQVPIVANNDCQKMFYQAGHHKAIQNNFVCAGYTNGGQDSCEGDSGGPLMVQRKDKRWVLVGTVSHGIGCADPNLPGVYMRMSSYRPWIDSIINK